MRASFEVCHIFHQIMQSRIFFLVFVKRGIYPVTGAIYVSLICESVLLTASRGLFDTGLVFPSEP